MKAFDLDRSLIANYESFSRSFSQIRAGDIKAAIDRRYADGHFWPDALLSLNPQFERGPSSEELVTNGVLDPSTGDIFRIDGQPIRFHAHQGQAIAKASAGKSFIVTTGTGSGKSLCFFVPIIDAIIRGRKAGEKPRTRAIIVYPMNALANSQMKEIEKFVAQSGLPASLQPVVRRYTGQEDDTRRIAVADNPPDILLTNFMMLELLLTRQAELDQKVIANAAGLEFVVLDELHTYRGRQGADVAVLMRRLKERCAPDKAPICIGTSATMASDSADGGRSESVAAVASKLFGVKIGLDAVIDESLRRATDDRLTLKSVTPQLAGVLSAPLPEKLLDADLFQHPLAVWAEVAIGLEDKQGLRRRKPIPSGEAAMRLAEASGLPTDACKAALELFLTRVSQPETARGGAGKNAFLAFKLHRFISGSSDVHTTLKAAPRTVLLEGQIEDPTEPGVRLYPTRFCRSCGQEFHVVSLTEKDGRELLIPRNIDEGVVDGDEDSDKPGFLTPMNDGDADYRFSGDAETFPETWVETSNGVTRLRSHYRKRAPKKVSVDSSGHISASGRDFWLLPGSFSFCPCCLDQPTARRDRNKLAGLSAEGRSSATTLLTSSILEWLNQPGHSIAREKRKLLGFTDNRQDAALQAGHFNDFVFVSLLRGALLRAVLAAGDDGLHPEDFGKSVSKALGFNAGNEPRRLHWMLDPKAGGVNRQDSERSLAKVLAHRVWADLRRGWRYTNPNLTGLNLLRIAFIGLDELAADAARLDAIDPILGGLSEEKRRELLQKIVGNMLEGLAVQTESLDPVEMDGVAQTSRGLLRTPWCIDRSERPQARTTLLLQAPPTKEMKIRDAAQILRGGVQSRLYRQINRASVLGAQLKGDDYLKMMQGLLDLLASEGIVTPVRTNEDLDGWRINPSAIRLAPGRAVNEATERGNAYFHNLYTSVANALGNDHAPFLGLEAREHTAQVPSQVREWREWRFRSEEEDKKNLAINEADMRAAGETPQFLPALFCSPTMELGVDISALNAVYLRNVPPTPANYAQRAGRAGRSGQAALIVTYCAALSPHDQYFFSRRNDMVAGEVRPPTLDITNEALLTSHLHAVWLAQSGLALNPNIPEILQLDAAGLPLKDDVQKIISDPTLQHRARGPMARLLEHVLKSNAGALPSWMENADSYVDKVARNAPIVFDEAFNRWRDLYNAALAQLRDANAKSVLPNLSAKERSKIKQAQGQAAEQLTILEQGKATNGSDFYSYRYLATEGFLPGYNFPRLPLYAFVPSEGRQSKNGAFLQRARFLAISEFGPMSLIYHEGRAYRVVRAKLPPGVYAQDGEGLATKEVRICPSCGAAHEEEVERCHACQTPMGGALAVKSTLRIDNVETAPAERITANDEERVRRGFEVQTVFAWPRRHGQIDIIEAELQVAEESLLKLQYANSAEISRLNLGLKSRKEKSILGFNIDPQTGRWVASPGDEDNDEAGSPDDARPVRIVPIVKDNKNALLLRFENAFDLDQTAIATVQHALMRGIEITYQLEEGEILGEPLPSQANRRAILAYEATEGGAGVLSQIISNPMALGRVARKALELMHFANVDEVVVSGDVGALKDIDEGACVRGCYHCLLSYFNQPDHELIDRRNDKAKELLVAMARGTVSMITRAPSSSGDGWVAAFAAADLPAPATSGKTFGEQSIDYVWPAYYAAAHPRGLLTPETRRQASDAGWTIVDLPSTPGDGVPVELIEILKG